MHTPLIVKGATYEFNICANLVVSEAFIESLSSWVMEIYFMESTYPYGNVTQKVSVALDPSTSGL